MLRFLKLLLIAPAAILFLIFAFANRRIVTISFDPFDSGDNPALSVHVPMFVDVIAAMMVGVLVGGMATWFSQGKHRRAARTTRAEAEKLRADLHAAKAALPPNFNLSRRA